MVKLNDIGSDDLAEELRKRGWVAIGPDENQFEQFGDEDMRDELVDRGFVVSRCEEDIFPNVDEARSLMQRGELRECLLILERDLPHEFSGLTEAIFKLAAPQPAPDIAKLPKRVQAIIDTVRHGQALCCHKRLNREGKTEKLWFFEPSGRSATPKAAEAATATAFLKPTMDGLLPNMSQTWRAAP